MELPQKIQDWLYSDKIQFYIYSRKGNKIKNPGQQNTNCAFWFQNVPLKYMNPLDIKERFFGEMIYTLDDIAFSAINMVSPRWAFYDCAILPGLVCGIALPSKLFT